MERYQQTTLSISDNMVDIMLRPLLNSLPSLDRCHGSADSHGSCTSRWSWTHGLCATLFTGVTQALSRMANDSDFIQPCNIIKFCTEFIFIVTYKIYISQTNSIAYEVESLSVLTILANARQYALNCTYCIYDNRIDDNRPCTHMYITVTVQRSHKQYYIQIW